MHTTVGRMIVESDRNDILLSALMVNHLPCGWYPYWTAYLYDAILKLSLDDPLIIVFTFKSNERLNYPL